ncbi:MAG: hypothetical protein ACI828_002065 [Flavobacteriales bacterium]|jgi:hypothetical protein
MYKNLVNNDCGSGLQCKKLHGGMCFWIYTFLRKRFKASTILYFVRPINFVLLIKIILK